MKLRIWSFDEPHWKKDFTSYSFYGSYSFEYPVLGGGDVRMHTYDVYTNVIHKNMYIAISFGHSLSETLYVNAQMLLWEVANEYIEKDKYIPPYKYLALWVFWGEFYANHLLQIHKEAGSMIEALEKRLSSGEGN